MNALAAVSKLVVGFNTPFQHKYGYMSKGTWTVKCSSNKILQFLTVGARG